MKKILFKEFSNCNNFNYQIEIGNFKLKITSKKINQSLYNNCKYFIGMTNKSCDFILVKNKKNNYCYYPTNKFWEKIMKVTLLDYYEIQSILNIILNNLIIENGEFR